MLLHKATAADADRLARLGERIFRETFASENTPEDMDAYVAASLSPDALARQLADPAAAFLLGAEDDRDVAYVKLRRGEAPSCVTGPSPLQIERFYVAKEHHGRGLAHDLMRAVIDRAPDATLWLGVWEKNARAIAFYEKWSFAIVGQMSFTLGSDPQTDHVMQRITGGLPP